MKNNFSFFCRFSDLRNLILSVFKKLTYNCLPGKKVVIAGCVSQGAPDTKFIEGLSIVGVQQIDRFVIRVVFVYR